MLRHSAAHLLAEAVRRLYPGVKIAIGPPIENGFYYDFEFPEPIREEDLEKIEAEILRELKEGRTWEREEISAEEAKQRFAAEGEPYKVELVDTAEGEISLYTQGEFTDLCRGPHLQDSKPIKAIKLTSLAGAYWRGDEKNTQLTRIYGTAFYSQADLDAYLERLEQAKARDHRRLGRELDLFHLSEESPGSPFWHPKGMVIWNELEDLRRRENAQPRLLRGEDAADLRHRRLGHERPLGEVPREHVPRRRRGRGAACRAEADELPGAHAPVRLAAAQLPRPPDPLRRELDPAPERARRRAPRPPPRPPRHPGRRAHLLHRGAGPGRDRRVHRVRQGSLRALRRRPRTPSSRRGPRSGSAPTRSGTTPRGSSRPRSSGTGSST